MIERIQEVEIQWGPEGAKQSAGFLECSVFIFSSAFPFLFSPVSFSPSHPGPPCDISGMSQVLLTLRMLEEEFKTDSSLSCYLCNLNVYDFFTFSFR